LAIPATYSEFEDRVRRYSEANREREDRDNRFTRDVFEETTGGKFNKELDVFEKWITRKNLRTGEIEIFQSGESLPEPKFASWTAPARSCVPLF